MKQRRYHSSIRMAESIKLLGIVLCFILFSQGCQSEDFSYEQMVLNYDDPESVFNTNIKSIRQLVQLLEDDVPIASVDSSDAHAYALYFEGQATPILFCRTIKSPDLMWPSLSIAPDGPDYYWKLGNGFLLDEVGRKIKVCDDAHLPYFSYYSGQWSCSVNGLHFELADNLTTDAFISVSTIENELAVFTFPTNYQLTIPTTSFHLPTIPQKAFYKDVFLDAGIGLTPRKFLYAARYLGLSTECISLPRSGATVEDSILQDAIMAGDEQDTNGRLLYPDGQPRYKLLFVDGGSSRTHGQSLSDVARQNMQQFVQNGGSYVGTCAGAFFASNGYDGNVDYPYYLNLFPATMQHTGLSGVTTGMFIDADSPLLNYYDYGGDNYVSEVRHNKGGFPVLFPSSTKILARFDYPEKGDVHMQPCAWSYKPDFTGGRLVMEGSHPEEVAEGERRDLTAAMLRYAMDGVGSTPVKGFLQNGRTRIMDKGTDANKPSHTKIGDLQCHHFAVNIPKDVEDVSICLEGHSLGEYSLSLNRSSFAYLENVTYLSSDKGACKALFFSSLESGIWYVCVKCLTSIESAETNYGQSYSDPLGVLNGLPYHITVSWQIKEKVITSISKTETKNVSARYYGINGMSYSSLQTKGITIREGKKVMLSK